jgi:cobalt-zinc-cadmium efflux system outer membrane protein
MVLALVAALAGSVARAEAAPLDLDDALARARKTNPAIQAALADVRAARGRLTQASVLAANPVFSTGAAHHTIGSVETNIDEHVSLGQELQVGGQRGLRMGAAAHAVERAEHALADRERLVDADVRRAFAGVVAAERRRVVAIDAARESERLADATAARVTHGDAARTDLDLAQLDALRTREEQTLSETAVVRAVAALAVALGAEPEETFVVAAPPEPPARPLAEPALVARALEVRPDLAAARAERARLDGEADLAHRSGRVPNPTIRGFYSHENGIENIVGGEIEVPLPVFDAQEGTETDLRGQAAAVGADVVRLERTIPREVHVAVERYRAATLAWVRYRDALPTTDAAGDRLDRARSAGLVSVVDIFVQEARLRETRRAAVDAWLDLQEAAADVVEAVGESPW